MSELRYEFNGLHTAPDAVVATVCELCDLAVGCFSRIQVQTVCEQYFVGMLVGVRSGPDGGTLEIMNPASDATLTVAIKQLVRFELQPHQER